MNRCGRSRVVRLARRVAIPALALLVACGGVLAQSAPAEAPPRAVLTESATKLAPVRAVARVGMTVSDLDRAVEFYTGVLGFEKIAAWESFGEPVENLTGVFGARTLSVRLRLGREELELTQYLAPEGRPIPLDSRSNDRWFQHIAIVVRDIDRAYAHLRAHKVRHASSGPQTLPKTIPNAAGISAFYFKDPDGHALEIIHFPQGKGDPRWQEHSNDSTLFLGIDHTAIVVADTDSSVRFYTGVLGMRVAGESENHGAEQEHLNNVFGARLRITALRAPAGPGIELLEYLAPAGGRASPADSKANDLWHWQTTLTCDSVTDYERALRIARASRVSPGVVVETDSSSAFMLRDPDGHAIVLTSSPPASSR
jgi:catechol 2,3-dioxygenase-like lactoylglutathione lyase family enzyme